MSSDVSASLGNRFSVASCSARTPVPPGGILTCWSQPSSEAEVEILDLVDSLSQLREGGIHAQTVLHRGRSPLSSSSPGAT
jgi:hypothetical protein